jgi:hypothetical protein
LNEEADKFIAQMCTQSTRKQQRGNHRRIPYSFGRRMFTGRFR